ncbi:MAG: hypothetical protein KA149_06930 [Chitinophagales bacterium]|nr:hypothetical protein [Chitinophagales bacterium]
MDNASKNILAIGLGLTLITFSNLIGHFAPPFSIFFTPVLLPLIIIGVNAQLYKTNFALTVAYNFALLLFNDVFIRFYAGGTYDEEGKGWIFLFFAMAFIIAFIMMIICAFITKQSHSKLSKTKQAFRNVFVVIAFTTLTSVFYCYVNAEI